MDNTLQDLGLALQLEFDRWRNGWRDPLRSLLEVEEISIQGLETDVEQFNELEANLFEFYAALTQDFLPSTESATTSLGAGSSLPVFQDRPHGSSDIQASRSGYSSTSDWKVLPSADATELTEPQSTATDSGSRTSNQHSGQEGKSLPEYLGDASSIESVRTPEQSTSDYPFRQSTRESSLQKVEPSSKGEIQPSSRQKDGKVTNKLVRLRVEQGSSIEVNSATEKAALSEPSRPMVTRRASPVVEKGLLGEVNRPDFQSRGNSAKFSQNKLDSFSAPRTLRDLAALVETSPDTIAHIPISTQPTQSDAGSQPTTISRKESLIAESSPAIKKGSSGEVDRPDFQSGGNSAKSFQNGLNSFSAPRTLRLAALVETSLDAIAHNPISTQLTQSDAGFQPTTIELINEEQHPESDSSFDLDTILDAVREEINQEYRRFYGS